jgi:hypothetical protein
MVTNTNRGVHVHENFWHAEHVGGWLGILWVFVSLKYAVVFMLACTHVSGMFRAEPGETGWRNFCRNPRTQVNKTVIHRSANRAAMLDTVSTSLEQTGTIQKQTRENNQALTLY